MKSGDYAETRAVIELRAAQGPGPTYLLDITHCLSAHSSVQLGGEARHACTFRTAEISSHDGLFWNLTGYLLSTWNKDEISQMSGCLLTLFQAVSSLILAV